MIPVRPAAALVCATHVGPQNFRTKQIVLDQAQRTNQGQSLRE